jgi:hypothetical protein
VRECSWVALFASASNHSAIHIGLLSVLVILIGMANQTIKLKHFTNHATLTDIEVSNRVMRSSSAGRICFFAKPILDSPKGRRYV